MGIIEYTFFTVYILDSLLLVSLSGVEFKMR